METTELLEGGMPREPTVDERAIAELVDTWMLATQAGDIDKVLSLMTDDVVFMVPGKAPFGKKEFAANARGMQDMRIRGKAKIEEIAVAGNWGWCRTHLEMTITPPEGEAMRRSGYTLTIFRKDGRWRLARDANLVSDS